MIKDNYAPGVNGLPSVSGPPTLKDCPHIHLSEAQWKVLGFDHGLVLAPGTKVAATIHCVVASVSGSNGGVGSPSSGVHLDLAVTDMEISKPATVSLYT